MNINEFGDAANLNDTLGNYLRNVSEDEEDDGQGRRRVIYRPFRLTNECPKWEIGDVFGDREQLREALRLYAVMTKRPIKSSRNDRKRYKAECKGKNCNWNVVFSKI